MSSATIEGDSEVLGAVVIARSTPLSEGIHSFKQHAVPSRPPYHHTHFHFPLLLRRYHN